jgi:hypothetical protein
MKLKNTKTIISILVVIAVIIAFSSVELSKNHVDTGNIDKQLSSAHDSSLRLITIRSDGSPLYGAVYSISSNPFGGSTNYIAKDSSIGAGEATGGIIMVSGMPPGNYNITELKAPVGYIVNGSSRIVELTSKHITTSAFVHSHGNDLNAGNSMQNRDVIYSAKFECGSVYGNDGPLRPGHYTTDISVFNRQLYTVPFLWNVVVDNGKSTTPILKTLQAQTSTSIICKDILQLFNIHNNTGNLVEGFVLIRPQLDLASFSGNSATVFSRPMSLDQRDLLDVQAFYSANALLMLPHDITMDKVLFSIVNDTSGKLPVSLIQKPLDITVPSTVNRIIDPESQVRTALSAKYNLSSPELAHIKIHIISISLGTSTTVDDHAISSFQVRPQSTS